MSGVREPRQRVREFSLFSSFPFSLPPSLSPAAGAHGTAFLSGISCQGSSRESGCRDPGDVSAPRREKLLHHCFVLPNPFGQRSRVFGCRSAGRGAAGKPGLGDSSRLGVRAEIASLLGAGRASRVHVRSSRIRFGAGAESQAELYPQPSDPQVPRPRGTGARLTMRVAGGGGAGRSYCVVPLVPRIEQSRGA